MKASDRDSIPWWMVLIIAVVVGYAFGITGKVGREREARCRHVIGHVVTPMDSLVYWNACGKEP